MIFDIVEVEEKIGYSFRDKMLLRKCFTHSSYANEHKVEDNELLEFFGDAILEMVVTEYLFINAKGREGELTNIRQQLVSKEPLLEAIKELDLSQYMLLGKGQNCSATMEEKLFSSLYEALVAGIYIDGGMIETKKFILRTLLTNFNKNKKSKKVVKKVVKEEPVLVENYKGNLQEYCAKLKLGDITYKLLEKSGPDHKPTFKIAVYVGEDKITEMVGASKKQAETMCAKEALKILKTRSNNK